MMTPDGLEMRQATPDDANAVRSLTREAYAKWVPLIGREPMPMTVDYVKALQTHRIDLLYRQECPAGLIETVPNGDHLLIKNVAVLPAFQGQGLGRRLLRHAEILASAAEKPSIRLYTNKLFADNIALYLRLGYQVDREEPFMGGVCVHMKKTLR